MQDRSDIVAGFPVRQIIIWDRCGGTNFNAGYFLPTYEVIYMICRKHFKLKPKTQSRGDVWRIPPERNNPHPAPFPVQLVETALSATNAVTVLDPFFGSGTTGVACQNLGLNYIGIEKTRAYAKQAVKRLRANRKSKP